VTRKRDDMMLLAAPLMVQMADGSSAALFDFIDAFRDELERQVAGILATLHRRDIVRQPGEVASLAVSAARVLFRRARGWRADGALPWVWAYRSIREEVVAQIGHPSVEFDARVHSGFTERRPASAEIDLREMAAEHIPIAAWLDAVEAVANERDQAVHLEYQVQKHLGDPSPANTVASIFDLSAANVRQIDRRVRTKLARHSEEAIVGIVGSTAA